MSGLNAQIDTIHALNIDKDVSTIAVNDLVNNCDINKESFIVSDADHELLILISFKNAIDLKYVKIYSFTQHIGDVDVSAPKRVRVYKINNLSVNFVDVSSMKADKTVQCKTPKLKRGQIIHLQKSSKNAIKFKQTKHLAIYIDSNQRDTEVTLINAITLSCTGTATMSKAASSTNKTKHILPARNHNEKSLYALPKCVSIKNGVRCDRVNNVLRCLCFYQSLDIDNNDSHRDALVKTFTDEYTTFLDDNIHMILNHNHEIEHIHKIAISQPNMNRCELSKCILAMRHHRDRQRGSDLSLSKEVMFWRETMDACHCYVYHMYDLGLRLEMDDIKTQTQLENDGDAYKPHFDARYSSMCEKMKAIRTNLSGLKQFTFTRYENNKFDLNGNDFVNAKELISTIQSHETFMDGLNEYMTKHMHCTQVSRVLHVLDAEEYDSEALEMDMETNEDSNIRQWFDDHHYLIHSISDVYKYYIGDIKLSTASFKIGYTFYYWRYHEKEEPELYITRKYESLKDEIQNNKIYRLTNAQLNLSIQKANQFVHTVQARKTTALRYWKDHHDINPFHYGIDIGAYLSVDHILSVLLYTDWSVLSTEFSATLRAKTPFETVSSIKNRNREFAIWSRLLRETIECFGNLGDPTKKDYDLEQEWKDFDVEIGPFYCGLLSVIVIPEFNICLNAPTSTTKQIEVAQRFAGDDGIILAMNNTAHMSSFLVPSWNCSWLSTFNGEDERLWMGGSGVGRINVETVRITATGANYQRFFTPLFWFDCMLTGVRLSLPLFESECTSSAYMILSRLIDYKTKLERSMKAFPKYMCRTFDAYTTNKTEIVIMLCYLEHCFGKWNHLIVNKLVKKQVRQRSCIGFKLNGMATTNLLKPIVFKLFDNLKRIRIHSTHPYANGIAEYEVDLLSLLSLLDASNVLEVTVHATHQYRIHKTDRYGMAQQTQHTGVSWLGLMWQEYEALLSVKYASKGWNICLKTESVHGALCSITDNLYILRH
eukprot:51370_1